MCEETAFGFVTLGIALGTDGDEKLSEIAYHLGLAAMKGANHYNNTAIKVLMTESLLMMTSFKKEVTYR